MIDFGVAVVTGWSTLRATVIAPIAMMAGVLIAAELHRSVGSTRVVLWAIIIATIISPDLVIGYAYSNFSLALARMTVANEALVTCLMGAKAMSVAAALAYFVPSPPLTASGRMLLRSIRDRIRLRDRLSIYLNGLIIFYVPVASVVFLFVFQQFEFPSLTNTVAWTVTLFDRQALLPDLSESAKPLAWPLLVEVAILAPLLFCVLQLPSAKRPLSGTTRRFTFRSWLAWILAIVAFFATIVLPFSILLRDAVGGLSFLKSAGPATVSYWKQISVALFFGMISSLFAYGGATGLLKLSKRIGSRGTGSLLLVLVCIPGLCGPLVPSLLMVDILQRSWFVSLRDTPLPVTVVLTLYLLPRALLIEILSNLVRDLPSFHLAVILSRSSEVVQSLHGRELLWQLRDLGRYCRVALLAYWGYLDLTASAMLAPMGMESVTVWLYNFMHYGRNASLSAMTLVATIVPVILFVGILLLRQLCFRVLHR